MKLCKTAFLLLFYCFCLIFLGTANANEEDLNTILLIGSESFNEHKLSILQHFHTNSDNIFDQRTFTPNIHIFHNGQFSLFKDNQNYLQFHTVDTNQSLVLTLKGTNELNLDELQLLHKLIYQINNGIIVIEIGPGAIQTRSLLDYSTFCWANAHLDSQLSGEEENRVFLCNGVKPSSVIEFIDGQSIVRSNKQIEPTVLPTAPQPRFWPTFIVSAVEVDSKKQRSNKHTAQPNARQTRIYGNKDKKKSEAKNEEESRVEVSTIDNKLKCKYRKSCYSGEEPPVIKPVSIAKEESKKVDVNSAEDVEVKTSSKLDCKYRKSCYDDKSSTQEVKVDKIDDNEEEENHKIDDDEEKKKEVESKPVKKEQKPSKSQKQDKKQSKIQQESENDKIVEVTKSGDFNKLDCKYRKSCYSDGKLNLDDIQKAKAHVPVRESKNDENVEIKDPNNKKLACKYRKSCYNTGKLPDINAINAAKAHVPVRESKNDETVEIKDPNNKKLACKYRKSCYDKSSTQETKVDKIDDDEEEEEEVESKPVEKEQKPSKSQKQDKKQPKLQQESKNDKIVEVTKSADFNKLDCKYRRSCYDSGKLNLDDIQKPKAHVPAKEPQAENIKKVDKIDPKLACKYRTSCYKTGKLDMNKINAAKAHVPKAEEKQEVQKVNDNVLDIKLKCKYIKSCIESHLKKEKPIEKEVDEESSHERREKKVKEEEPVEEIPVVVVEEVEIEEETPEIIEKQPRKSKKEKPVEIEKEEPIEEKEEEEEEDLTEKPSKKSLHKSKEVSAEYKKKDPNRYVNTFKTVGRYEKLPKNETIDEEEQIEEEQVEEQDSEQENEVEDASVEIAEPIIQTVIEEDQEEEEESANEEIEEEPIVSEKQIEDPTVDEEIEKDTHTEKETSPDVNKVDISSISYQDKLRCKYRKQCMHTGVLPDLDEEQKNAKIRGTVNVRDSIDVKSKGDELDKVACKYRHSCYSKYEKEAKKDDVKVLHKKSDDQKMTQKKPIEKDEEPEVNKTVVDLSSILERDKLNCKYRRSCYSTIQTPQQKPTSSHRTVVPIPVESLRIKNQKCHVYYLSCREEMGLPVREPAPKVNGRRLCRKKKPNEQTVSE